MESSRLIIFKQRCQISLFVEISIYTTTLALGLKAALPDPIIVTWLNSRCDFDQCNAATLHQAMQPISLAEMDALHRLKGSFQVAKCPRLIRPKRLGPIDIFPPFCLLRCPRPSLSRHFQTPAAAVFTAWKISNNFQWWRAPSSGRTSIFTALPSSAGVQRISENGESMFQRKPSGGNGPTFNVNNPQIYDCNQIAFISRCFSPRKNHLPSILFAIFFAIFSTISVEATGKRVNNSHIYRLKNLK